MQKCYLKPLILVNMVVNSKRRAQNETPQNQNCPPYFDHRIASRGDDAAAQTGEPLIFQID
jgi:hypothetical protein